MTLNPSPPPAARTVPIAWFAVALLVVAGVAVAATAGYYALRPTSTPGSIALTDDLGRNVTVPYDPSRVVVLSPSIVDTMYRLGLRSHIVGVDCYAPALGGISEDYSPDQVALWGLNSSMCVEIGPTFDFESLLNQTPQLVLASTIVSVESVEQITTTYHIPVVMLQPPTVNGVLVDVSMIGRIFGVESQANALNAQLSTELASAANAVGSLESFPTVLVTYDVDQNGYWTFGPDTFGQSLIELSGAANIAAAANGTFAYPELSGEQVLAADPAYLVYATGYGLTESTYANAPFWHDLTAVNDGNLTGIDSNWITEPDPTMILSGLPALIAAFHPST